MTFDKLSDRSERKTFHLDNVLDNRTIFCCKVDRCPKREQKRAKIELSSEGFLLPKLPALVLYLVAVIAHEILQKLLMSSFTPV